MNLIFQLVVTAILIFQATGFGENPISLPPTTRVQIVNATSVANVELSINSSVRYPMFPQGLYTADAPTEVMSTTYNVKDVVSSKSLESTKVAFTPNVCHSVVIVGDFSTEVAPGEMLQPGAVSAAEPKRFPPSVLYFMFPHEKKVSDGLVRLRVINGMPGKALKFSDGKMIQDILPGKIGVMDAQPPLLQYTASVDNVEISVLMRQEDLIRNAMVIFYLTNGAPTFMRAFESN